MRSRLVILAASILALAVLAVPVYAVPVPEIDPGSGMSALALLSGALLVIRAAARK